MDYRKISLISINPIRKRFLRRNVYIIKLLIDFEMIHKFPLINCFTDEIHSDLPNFSIIRRPQPGIEPFGLSTGGYIKMYPILIPTNLQNKITQCLALQHTSLVCVYVYIYIYSYKYIYIYSYYTSNLVINALVRQYFGRNSSCANWKTLTTLLVDVVFVKGLLV